MLRRRDGGRHQLGRRVKPILEAGDLVPDDLMIELIRKRLQAPEAAVGFILDGFPRTMAQADALDSMLAEIDRPLSVVLELQVPGRGRDRAAAEARRRGGALRRHARGDRQANRALPRADEAARLHYRLAGNLVGIHGDRPENEVFAEIQQAVEQARVAAL